VIIRGSAVPLEASLREHQPWFDRLTNHGGCHSGLDPESEEGRGGLIQTLNQVQGDGLRLWVTDCVLGEYCVLGGELRLGGIWFCPCAAILLLDVLHVCPYT